MMNFDLHMNRDTIQPLTKAGVDFLHSVLLKGPVYPPRDYQNARANGLHVSFEDKSTLEQVTDPDTARTEWAPIPENPYATPGYSDDSCDADDSPDAAICPEYPNSDQTEGE